MSYDIFKWPAVEKSMVAAAVPSGGQPSERKAPEQPWGLGMAPNTSFGPRKKTKPATVIDRRYINK